MRVSGELVPAPPELLPAVATGVVDGVGGQVVVLGVGREVRSDMDLDRGVGRLVGLRGDED